MAALQRPEGSQKGKETPVQEAGRVGRMRQGSGQGWIESREGAISVVTALLTSYPTLSQQHLPEAIQNCSSYISGTDLSRPIQAMEAYISRPGTKCSLTRRMTLGLPPSRYIQHMLSWCCFINRGSFVRIRLLIGLHTPWTKVYPIQLQLL